MRQQACLPSMKPLGIALGVRISYLSHRIATSVRFFVDKYTEEGSRLWMFHTPLAELLEDDSVGETLSADSDPLQHTVTPQLLQDQVSVQLSSLRRRYLLFYCISDFVAGYCVMDHCDPLVNYPFLVVGDDAPHKVRLGIVQCGHEFGQRFLVQLSDCAEHPLLGLGGTRHRAVCHLGNCVETHDSVG